MKTVSTLKKEKENSFNLKSCELWAASLEKSCRGGKGSKRESMKREKQRAKGINRNGF